MKYMVTIDDKRYEVEVEEGEAAIVGTTEVAMAAAEKQAPANTPAPVKTEAPKETPTDTFAGKEVVKAPMAGVITDIKVSVGTAVNKGDILVMLEAMKMENEIVAHAGGTVAQILVTKGAVVATDDVLVVLS